MEISPAQSIAAGRAGQHFFPGHGHGGSHVVVRRFRGGFDSAEPGRRGGIVETDGPAVVRRGVRENRPHGGDLVRQSYGITGLVAVLREGRIYHLSDAGVCIPQDTAPAAGEVGGIVIGGSGENAVAPCRDGIAQMLAVLSGLGKNGGCFNHTDCSRIRESGGRIISRRARGDIAGAGREADSKLIRGVAPGELF